MLKTVVAWVVSGLASTALAAQATPTVKINSGLLSGTEQAGALVFRGVPFAAPPVGDLRWSAPHRAASWTGVRAADHFSAICPQPMNANGTANAGGASGKPDEDCLYLNLWAPKAAKGAAVMVWVHGGGNVTGAGSLGPYDGTAFARDGVILVTINYRLGALGFFAHPALTAAAKPGEPLISYGLMDQIAALEWVKRNIAAFGGDPAKVTVFGESAGGADILALLATPKAKGLFARAIVESGGGWSAPVPLAKREQQGEALMQSLGLPAAAGLQQIRGLAAATIAAKPTGDGGGVGIDGRLLTQSPAQAFARGRQNPVPLIIGSNSYEASLIKTEGGPNPAILAGAPDALKAAYADEPTDADKTDALFTDGVMGAPAHWLAGRAKGPVWLYYFPYVLKPMRAALKGAPHAFEIPYVFDSWDHLGALAMGLKPDAEAQGVTRMMHGCWISFAKTGTPQCPEKQPWPAFTNANDTLLRLDAAPVLVQHFRAKPYQAQEAAKLPTLSLDAR